MRKAVQTQKKIVAIALALLMVFSMSSPTSIAGAVADVSGQTDAATQDVEAVWEDPDNSDAELADEASSAEPASEQESASSASNASDDTKAKKTVSGVAKAEKSDAAQSSTEVESSEDGKLSTADAGRAAEAFDADKYISKLTLSLTSGDVTKEYEVSGGGTIDTRDDFSDGLSRSATYVASLNIDIKGMLEAQNKYPLVAGDTVTCSVPDIIRTGGTTSGRLIDTTADWNDDHNGVGDYTVTQDENGHNILTIKYDDGYVTEKSGKIISSSVRLSGGFDTSSQTTESFETDLVFGNFTVKTKFSKLEVIRNLSIEKTGETDEAGTYLWGSNPSYPRKGSAVVDSNGFVTYTVTATAGQDNTYKLTNVTITDLFDDESKSKVDLSTMTLVSAVVDSEDKTSSATPVRDGDGNVNGWNVGDLPIGASAIIKFKVKIDKDGITNAVDAAKKADAASDAIEARTIKNTAMVSADDTKAASDDYSTYVENYVKISKSTGSFDQATQRQHFKITVTAPADNRYTLHNVPIYDYLYSGALASSYYKGSGIASMSVKHADGTTEDLAWSDYEQVDESGKADSRSWYANISEMRPGDIVTIDAYLEVDQSYWDHKLNDWTAGNSTTWNRVHAGNLSTDKHCAGDLNLVYDYSTFYLAKQIIGKNSPNIQSDGTVNWVITGNEAGKSLTPTDIGGETVTDTLGPNQVFKSSEATVTFYNQDGSVAGTKTFPLTDNPTSFTYAIPTEYGTCGYKIEYTTQITDWDTYVGPAKRYTNTVNGYTASTSSRARVAAMSKEFVEQEDNWSRWQTKIYSELEAGDTYRDYSGNYSHMYFTDDDLEGITLSIDGVAVDASLYQISSEKISSSENKYSAYTITFNDTVSVDKDGQALKPSKDHPLIVSYKAHMVNPSLNYGRTYYNYATLKAGNVTDTDQDYCKRYNVEELSKSVASSSGGNITWKIDVNRGGYAGQSDGTCLVTDTLPAGLSYVSLEKLSGEGTIESVTPTVNEDGATTLAIRLSGLYHDECCKAHPRDNNSSTSNTLHLSMKTKITSEDFLYGAESKSFDFVNTVNLSDRYKLDKSASATASIEHVAMQKTMAYGQSTAPYAQFTIEANVDRADLNPDGDTVRIVDESSKSLSIDTKSIKVLDGKTGDPVDFTLDASQMANNIFVVEVPDNTHVKIIYQAQVIGVVGESVPVSNNAYYEGHRTTSGESTVDQKVIVLKTSGEAESVPMVWFSKKNESAQALAGAVYKLDVYNESSKKWETVRDDVVSTGDNTRKGVKVEDLELDKLYRLVETEAPDNVFGAPEGYVLDATPHYFVLYKDTAPTVSYPDDIDPKDVFKGPSGSVITAYDAPYTRVRFAKMSDDGVQLAGAEFTVYPVDADGKASDTPARDKSGNEVKFTSSADVKNEFVIAPGTYQLVETKVPAGYAKADPVTFVVKGDSEHTVTVNGEVVQTGLDELDLTPITGNLSMTDSSAVTSLAVSKVWDDCNDFDQVRPSSVSVQLYADYSDGQGMVPVAGTPAVSVTAEGPDGREGTDDDWTASFDELPVMKAGKLIAYTVKEIDAASGQAVESGTTMQNGYTVAVSATQGDVQSGSADAYSVTVTNSYTPKKTKVSVSKSFDDAGDHDGKRPLSITVQLFADGQALEGKTLVLDAGNSWAGSFDELDAANADGSAIVYTVKELDDGAGGIAVEFGTEMSNGYTPNLSSSSYAAYPDGVNPIDESATPSEQQDERGIFYAISNVHVPETVQVSLNKAWVDGDGASRPDSITVNLLKDGEQVDSVSVGSGADGTWSHTFADLEKYDSSDHHEYVYTVEEKAVDGYRSIVSGDMASGFTITNVKTTSVDVTKKWAGDKASDRPDSIAVDLLRDGTKVDTATVAPGADGKWSCSFEGLDGYDPADGHEYAYTVSEQAVSGYSAKVTGDAASGFTITNTKAKDTTPSDPVKPGTSDNPGSSGGSGDSDKAATPQTGDQLAPCAAAAAALLVVCIVAVVLMRARRRKSSYRGKHSI